MIHFQGKPSFEAMAAKSVKLIIYYEEDIPKVLQLQLIESRN